MKHEQLESQEEDLLTSDLTSRANQKNKKVWLIIIFGGLLIAAFVIFFLYTNSKPELGGKPKRIQIPWFSNQDIVIELGTTRVFEVLYFSGRDDRNRDDFVLVTERAVQWTSQPEGIIQLDMYGRVQPLKIGTCTLRVQSLSNPGVYDSKTVKVVQKISGTNSIKSRIINYSGNPAEHVNNLQKLVQRYKKQNVQNISEIPSSVKYASANPTQDYQKDFTVDEITWETKGYANGSSNTYLLRTNTSKPQYDRDKYQYFIGDRYLPDKGDSIVMITDDLLSGVWVVSSSGDVNHIIMKQMTYKEKAVYMREQTRKIERYGIVSGGNLQNNTWIPGITDNDGLWTSLFGAGELMRYAVMKRENATQQQIKSARTSALRSLKAVLMIANVSGRNLTIPAKIRHLKNTRIGDAAFYQKQYLKKNKQLEVEVYPGDPTDGINLYGVDAGQTIDGNYYPGSTKYTFGPTKPEDWTETQQPATSKRYLNNFISRSFMIPEREAQVGGLWFHRNKNGTQTVVSDANVLYDFDKTDKPVLDIGDTDIPQVLLDILNIDGKQYNKYDINYKGDTSTDQIIGHLFIYKIGFDILDENDEEQGKVKQLIRETVVGFCQHLVNNGYVMVDATGQGTKWAKLTRQFFTSDNDVEDAPLKIIELILSMKMAYYVTGQKKWRDEYQLLVSKSGPYNYLKTVASLYERFKWLYTNVDDSQYRRFNYSKKYSNIQIERHVLYQTHFSDEEQAFLAYYLAFQLQDNPQYLEFYRKGIQGYWVSISQSQNPLWYYIYQLAYPNQQKKDKYGENLLEVASWQLSRHMIDTRKYQAYIPGSRPDVIFENLISVNPYVILQTTRISQDDKKYVNSSLNYAINQNYSPQNIYQVKVLPADERSLHKFNGANFEKIGENHVPTQMQGSTTYTLPYWLGVYHNMLTYN